MHDDQRQALRIAYVAGLLDGEGSFLFMRSCTPEALRQTNRKNPIYSGKIRVGMVHKGAVEYIADTFPGGRVLCEGVRKGRPTYQIMYRWELCKRLLILDAIPKLIPHLVIKKEQALLLQETLTNWEIPFNRKLGMSPQEIQRRDQAWLKMRQLNAVGAAATTKSQSIREDEAIV